MERINPLIEVLKKAKDENKLVQFHINPDEVGEHGLGYILEMTDEEVIFKMMDEDGGYNSIKAEYIEKIFLVQIDRKSIKTIEQLCRLKDEVLPEVKMPWEGESFFERLLIYAKDNGKFVNIEIKDEEEVASGKVVKVKKDRVIINRLDEAEFIGTEKIAMEDIVDLWCDDKQDRAIERLHRIKGC